MSYPFKIQMNNSLRMANGWPMRSVEPVIEQRIFITADPAIPTYYTMESPVVLSGDFEIEAEVVTTADDSQYRFILGRHEGDRIYLAMQGGNLVFGNGAAFAQIPGALLNDGKRHTAKLSVLSGNAIVSLDGINVKSEVLTGSLPLSISAVGVNTDNPPGSYWDGIIANPTITDISNPANSESWKLDQPHPINTEQSSSGNNLLTYVGATEATRELFTKDGSDWLGVERVVNGGFDSDTGWVKAEGATIAGGVGNLSTLLSSVLQQTASLVTGLPYRVEWDVVVPSISNGVVWSSSGCWGSKSFNPSVAGSNSQVFLCVNGSAPIRVITSATDNATSIDNVSVKRILQSP